jgi:hypothetical protein
MHFRILPDHQKNVMKKDIFDRLEWLKTCFDAFAQTPRPPETFVQKRYFYCLEWLKTCFNAFAHMYFQPTKNVFCIKDIFESLEWLKRVLMHLRILPDHQKLFFQNRYFY